MTRRLDAEDFPTVLVRMRKAFKKKTGFLRGRKVVAFSGGADSVVLGYLAGKGTPALHLNLGIKGHSAEVERIARKNAEALGLQLEVIDVEEYGARVETRGKRPPCSVCGVVKRYVLNAEALKRGFKWILTGHNLDDLAAFVFQNLMAGRDPHVAVISYPGKGLAGRVKPLAKFSEEEIRKVVKALGLEEPPRCPLGEGSSQRRLKRMMTSREWLAAKRALVKYFSVSRAPPSLRACEKCGFPTSGRFCAFCRLFAEDLHQEGISDHQVGKSDEKRKE